MASDVRVVVLALAGMLTATVGGKAGGADAHFTTGTETAAKYGVHEISLTGNGGVANPFDTIATATFTPPSGGGNAKTVNMFYDGGNTWRARVYVTETGAWTWSSRCASDSGLNNQSGSFTSADTSLKGMLRRHASNSKALRTDDGSPFHIVGDTAYYLLNSNQADWQNYVADNSAYNITLMRCSVLGALRNWDYYWDGTNKDKFNLARFQNDDVRLQWMLNHHPDMYVELILFPESNTGWNKDETLFASLTDTRKQRLLRFLVARYAAYPQIFWEIVNDYNYSSRPKNQAMAHYIGNYLLNNDPWQHFVATGAVRNQAYPFSGAAWSSFIHLETEDAVNADQVETYASAGDHVFCGEDRYETYKAPTYPRYFFRRLMWAWLLSGGSACYGGDWDDVRPYTTTGMVGLHSVRHIRPYLDRRHIDLGLFTPDDALADDPDRSDNALRPHLAHRGTDEYLVYHPNCSVNGAGTNVSNATARINVNLTGAGGTYSVEWFRAHDGVCQRGSNVSGGGWVTFTAPWAGQDVVLRVYRDAPTAPDAPSDPSGRGRLEQPPQPDRDGPLR